MESDDQHRYLERRVHDLEVFAAGGEQRLAQLEEAAGRLGRLLETVHEAMTNLSYRTEFLERWRQRDEPRIEAGQRADELAALLAENLQRSQMLGWRRWTRWGAIAVGLITFGAFVAQLLEVARQ